MTGEQAEALVRRLDRQLTRLENQALAVLRQALRESSAALELELRTLYRRAQEGTASAGAHIREAAVRDLLEQTRVLDRHLDLRRLPTEAVLSELQRGAMSAGAENALRALTTAERAVAGLSAAVPVERLAAATGISQRLQDIGAARVANGTRALIQHGQDAADKIQRHITAGVVQGRGWGATSRLIRREVGLLNYEAERIVRTESITASDAARREQYRDHGVEHVRVLATMDDRVCGYCAFRSGRIYPVDEIELPFHPNCRCTTVPVRPEWVAAGVDDPDWYDEHHAATVELAREQGHKIHTGPAPSEKWRGRDTAPQAIPYDEFRRAARERVVA